MSPESLTDQTLRSLLRERFARRLQSERGTGVSAALVDGLVDEALCALRQGRAAEAEPGCGRVPACGAAMEQELESSEGRYRSLLEIAPDAICIVQGGVIVFTNDAAVELVGARDAADFLGTSLDDYVHPDDLARSLERRKLLEKGVRSLPRTEMWLRRRDGAHIEVETRAAACEFGGTPAIQIVARDVTARNRSARWLEDQNRVLELIATGAPIREVLTALVTQVEHSLGRYRCAVYLWNPAARTLSVGAAPSVSAAFNGAVDGMELDDRTGSCGPALHSGRVCICTDVSHDPLWEPVRELARREGIAAAWSTPIRGRGPERGAAAPDDTVLGTFAVYCPEPHVPSPEEMAVVERAVHLAKVALEQSRAREELEASETRYRAFVEQSVDPLYLFDDQNRIVDVNTRACEKLGYSRDELIGATPLLFDPAVDVQSLREINAAIEVNDFHIFETRHRRRTGEEYPVEVRARKFLLNGARHIVATARDITRRLESERALRDSEARYRQLAEAMPQMVWSATSRLDIVYVNERARRVFGPDGARDPASILHPDDLPLTRARWLAAGEQGVPFEVEHRIRVFGTGDFRWFLTRGVPIRDESGGLPRWVGTTTDVHAMKLAQLAVRAERDRLTRMASIVPGVIHTIRVRADGSRSFDFVGDSIAEVLGVSAADVFASVDAMNRFVHPDDLAMIVDSAARSARDLSPWHCEYRVRHPRRGEVWIETRSVPAAEPDGAVLWHGFLTDITPRKAAEAALLAKQERLVETQAIARLGSFDWDLRTGAVDWSDELYRIYGVEREGFDPAFEAFLALVHPEDRERIGVSIQTALDGGGAFVREQRIVRPDGGLRYIETRGQVLRDAEGRPARMSGACLDITDRKLVELRLADSERRFRSLADGIPQIVWGAAATGEIELMNARTTEFTGHPVTDLTGWQWGSVIHPDDLQRVVAHWSNVVQTGRPEPIEFRIRRHDGEYRWFLTRQVPVLDDSGRIQAWYGTCTDVHDARETAQAIRSSQDRLAAVIRNAPGVAIQFFDRSGRIVLWNAASQDLFGFRAEEAVGLPMDRLIHTPAEFRQFLTILDDIERTGQPAGPTEYTFRRKSGEPGVCLSTIFPIPGERGEQWFVCMDVDITERIAAERRLRDSETLLRDIIDNAPSAIFVKDLAGRFTVVNRYFCDLHRQSIESVLGRTTGDLASPEVTAESDRTDRLVVETNSPVEIEETIAICGRERTFVSTKFPIHDDEGRVRAVAGVCTDITDHIRLEEQLRQSQKMEAIGRLAGGIAHDFNNMLLVINGYADIILEALPAGDRHRPPLEGIREAGRRAADLTSQLLAFSRKSPIRPRVLDINRIVLESEALFRRLIGETIHLELELDPAAGHVRADRSHIEQVLLNLIVNARDAMPGGGASAS